MYIIKEKLNYIAYSYIMSLKTIINFLENFYSFLKSKESWENWTIITI